jgi:ribonuclease P protein subunit RPR2
MSRFQGAPQDEETVASLRARLDQLEAEASARQSQLERYAADLREIFKQERHRSQELRRSYKATVLALANAVEARDAYTHRHAQRVAAYGLRIAHAAGVEVDPQVEFGFLLHDVGKVAVPDAILFKPGPLSDAERALVRKHPETGTEILRHIEFLDEAKTVVRHHHERWDGTGYPDRLVGDAIPVHARVFAVADTLDAITTDRPYRRASSWSDARAAIQSCAGSQFDPEMVAAYEEVSDEAFARIREGVE